MSNSQRYDFKKKANPLAGAVGSTIPKKGESDFVPQSKWEDLDPIREECRNWVMVNVESIHRNIALIRTYGCKHVDEFEVAAKSVQADLEHFVSQFEEIQKEHAGKSGPIQSPDDHVLMLAIFERYVQLSTTMEGVLTPTLVAFTEYALEAKDLAREAVAKNLTPSEETTEVKQ